MTLDPVIDPLMDPVADPAAVVPGDRWRITVLTDGLVRLEYAPDGQFEDRATTFAVARRHPAPEFRVLETDDHVEVVTRRFRLTYDRRPFTPSGLSLAVGGGVTTYHSVWRFGDAVNDLGGTARTLDGVDGATPVGPAVVSRNGFAVIDDSDSFVVDAEGRPHSRRTSTTGDGVSGDTSGARHDLYVFAYGHDYYAALTALYAVSGPTPVIPRWALGTWWSRYHRYTAQAFQDVVARFEQERIPLSVAVIDMDWHLTDIDPALGSGWTGYTWNRDHFPDPEAFLAWLHRQGLRTSLNVHPADGVRAHEEAYADMCAALGRDAGLREPIAFDVTDERFVTAYFEILHHRLEEQGVDFWWLDWQQGAHSRLAGVDPLWVLNREHYLDSARDGRRGLTFSRYAGPGSHRYPIGFSGDSIITWASLAFQPAFTATASNIGYGWWSHDIGGHFFGVADDELATRWVQLGTFSPILRLHSSNDPFLRKEPWEFPAETRAAMTAALRWRHRLVPYLHTMNHRAAADGVPIVLPMYYDDPDEPSAYSVPHEFRFGTSLLVSPITAPADPSTRLGSAPTWLPAGRWVDLLTDLVYDAGPRGRLLHLHRDRASIPVLAPAGAIVPLDGSPILPNDPVNPEHVTLVVVAGADGRFDLVEDDGRADGEVVRTSVEWQQRAGRLVVRRPVGALGVAPVRRTWSVVFPALSLTLAAPRATVDGEAIDVGTTPHDSRLVLHLGEQPATAEIVVDLWPDPTPATSDLDGRLYALLLRAQLPFALKSAVFAAAATGSDDRTVARRASDVAALELDQPLQQAVLELLLAAT